MSAAQVVLHQTLPHARQASPITESRRLSRLEGITPGAVLGAEYLAVATMGERSLYKRRYSTVWSVHDVDLLYWEPGLEILCGKEIKEVLIPAPGTVSRSMQEKHRVRMRFADLALVDDFKHVTPSKISVN
jgi:hypothetical protein